MGGKPKMPPPPEPARMPVPDDANAKAARRRSQNELMASRGRRATDLTDDDGGNTKLGA